MSVPLRPENNPHLTPRDAVIATELAWHEQESNHRRSLDGFLYGPPAFDRLVDSELTFLQTSPGQQILDLGCGEGRESLALAKHGLVVISVDLTYRQIMAARQYIQENLPAAQVFFLQADAERLPFAKGSFHTVYGKAILHHLDIDRAAQEVQRLLVPRGRAVFAEPMRYHPLFWLARKLTPRLRTRDEHPLRPGELASFGSVFSSSTIEAYFLIAPLAYGLRLLPASERLFRKAHAFLQRADTRLFKLFPSLKKLAWYGVIKVAL
jgi:SAM-dependent methyltransferase